MCKFVHTLTCAATEHTMLNADERILPSHSFPFSTAVKFTVLLDTVLAAFGHFVSAIMRTLCA